MKDYLFFPVFYLSLLGLILGLYFYTLETIVLFITFMLFIIFTTNFPTGDPERYYLEDLSFLVIFFGFGIICLYKLIEKNLQFGFSVMLFLSLLIIPLYFYKSNYKLVDKSSDYSAKMWSEQVFNSVLPDSIILSWWSYSTPLWYRQRVLHERKDVIIINKNQWEWKFYVSEFLDKRPIYIIEYEPKIASDFRIVSNGVIYRVLP